jgi:transposase
MGSIIDPKKIKIIYALLFDEYINIKKTARKLQMSRNTVKKYLANLYRLINMYPDKINNLSFYVDKLKRPNTPNNKLTDLQNLFPSISGNILAGKITLLTEWNNYKVLYPGGLSYSQFNSYFTKWCKANNIKKLVNRWRIPAISEADTDILKKWRRGSDKRKWEKAVIITGASQGETVHEISVKVSRTTEKVKEWIKAFRKKGIEGLNSNPRKLNQKLRKKIEEKKNNLIRLIHETPKLHNINRTSWSLEALSIAYEQRYKSSIGSSTISEYIRRAGYSFRKAKETLTSTDPDFRIKLSAITKILSELTPNQKFFSVDEFGPFAVKIKGGRAHVKINELRTYPQLQKSKGCIICTAALELSTNQITHFYSLKKNTEEMIKLLELLLLKYKDQEKIFFSWDAASWHASKNLFKKISEVNDPEYRLLNGTPLVELAPLPASAQFLNVIESVFSGLAKGVIHNSNYDSVEECKSAISLYFEERNKHFLEHPHRAGNKIWGKELAEPIFDESKNFKDPRWR